MPATVLTPLLQMIDRKHRKASNLNRYHAHWNTQYDGDQNFFHVRRPDAGASSEWAPHSGSTTAKAKTSTSKSVRATVWRNNVSCAFPRLRRPSLSNLRRYLSAEQRLNYLVKVAEDGKLVWARSPSALFVQLRRADGVQTDGRLTLLVGNTKTSVMVRE